MALGADRVAVVKLVMRESGTLLEGFFREVVCDCEMRRAGIGSLRGGITTMQPRIDYRKFAQEPIKPLLDLERYLPDAVWGTSCST
jgi:hypothetical protein